MQCYSQRLPCKTTSIDLTTDGCDLATNSLGTVCSALNIKLDQCNTTVTHIFSLVHVFVRRTLQESYRDGPPPTALASPGGIKDERIQELAPRKPALNELPNAEGKYSLTVFVEAPPYTMYRSLC